MPLVRRCARAGPVASGTLLTLHPFILPPGAAITFARTYLLSPGAGRRPSVPAVLVVLADGPSADDAITAARDAKAAGEVG